MITATKKSLLTKACAQMRSRASTTVAQASVALDSAPNPAMDRWVQSADQKSANGLFLHFPEQLSSMIERVASDMPCPIADVDRPSIALIGFPYGSGTRAGAREGVAAIRKQLDRFETRSDEEAALLEEHLGMVDLGDINDGAGSMREAHNALYFRVREALNAGHTPWIIGGGKRLSALNARALADAAKAERAWRHDLAPSDAALPDSLRDDASLDKVSMLDVRSLVSEAVSDHAWRHDLVSSDEALPEELRAGPNLVGYVLSELADQPLVSFDVGSISAADMPACGSADRPGVDGLSAVDALTICEAAGASPSVQLVDLPDFDPRSTSEAGAHRSAKLCASMFHSFACGRAAAHAAGTR